MTNGKDVNPASEKPDFIVELNKGEDAYRESLGVLLVRLKSSRTGYLIIGVQLPKDLGLVYLQLKCEDIYIVGFKGKKKGKDNWYHFKDQRDGWGDICGVESNYNNLTELKFIKVDFDSLKKLSDLANFELNNQEKKPLNKEAVITAIFVISEAIRDLEVEKQFASLLKPPETTSIQLDIGRAQTWQKRSELCPNPYVRAYDPTMRGLKPMKASSSSGSSSSSST